MLNKNNYQIIDRWCTLLKQFFKQSKITEANYIKFSHHYTPKSSDFIATD